MILMKNYLKLVEKYSKLHQKPWSFSNQIDITLDSKIDYVLNVRSNINALVKKIHSTYQSAIYRYEGWN